MATARAQGGAPSLATGVEGACTSPAAARQDRAWRAVLGASVGVYLLAGGALALGGRWHLNPDGVAYVQVARHYLAGRTDLAVNSYWGPLLSWLMAPALAAGAGPALTGRLINVLAGLALAAGLGRLAGDVTASRGGARLGVLGGLAMALGMAGQFVTPDVLLAALMTWYFLAAAPLARTASPGRAFGAGVLGGLAYLTKAYALPFVSAHLLATALLSRGPSPRRRVALLGAAGAGLALGAGPWVAVISAHDGHLTIGSAGAITRAAYSPASAPPAETLAIHRLQVPRPGRVTSWENPVEIAHPFPFWSPLEGLSGLHKQWVTLRDNCVWALLAMASADGLGLLAVVGLVGTAAGIRRRDGRLTWLGLSALLYVGGYVLIHVEARLLWPIWPLTAAVGLGLFGRWGQPAGGSDHHDRPPSGQPWRRRLAGAAAAVLIGAIAVQSARTGLAGLLRGRNAQAAALARAGAASDLPLVSNRWGEGLIAAFWAEGPYYGQFSGATAPEVAAELAPFGPLRVVVVDDKALARRLARDARFTPPAPAPPLPPGLDVLDFRP